MSKNNDLVRPCPFCGDPMENFHGVIRHTRKTDDRDEECPIGIHAWDEGHLSKWNRRHSDAIERGAAQGVWVKLLDWVKHPNARMWRAETMLGIYEVADIVSTVWQFKGYRDIDDAQRANNEGEAKAAAQADYEQRIMSALDLSTPPAPTPQPPAVEAEAVNPETGMADLSLRGILAATHSDHQAAIKAKTDEIERLMRERDKARAQALENGMALCRERNHRQAAEVNNKALREGLAEVRHLINTRGSHRAIPLIDTLLSK